MNMENINTLGQTPEDIKELLEIKLKKAEEVLRGAEADKRNVEDRGDTDAIALAETRIEHAEAAVEKAKRDLEEASK